MVLVNVLSGDITEVEAGALIATIRPDGTRTGLLDQQIEECAGALYHSQIEAMRLTNLEAVMVTPPRRHYGSFACVIFVPHHPRESLRKVISAGLITANVNRLRSVVLPVVRNGLRVDDHALKETALAVKSFMNSDPSHLSKISIVVNYPRGEQYLKRVFNAM
ncbi:MAG TPA: hypothetical protein VK502_04305 [Candidatus Saccharimonadales bacterium]|nr:hypothetical protein [Candidatus Saccharimonadales bacterium]